MWHNMGFSGMMWYGWLFWIIILIAIVYLIVRLTSQGGRSSGNQQGETALDILKERFARGEISKEEFESMKKDL